MPTPIFKVGFQWAVLRIYSLWCLHSHLSLLSLSPGHSGNSLTTLPDSIHVHMYTQIQCKVSRAIGYSLSYTVHTDTLFHLPVASTLLLHIYVYEETATQTVNIEISGCKRQLAIARDMPYDYISHIWRPVCTYIAKESPWKMSNFKIILFQHRMY